MIKTRGSYNPTWDRDSVYKQLTGESYEGTLELIAIRVVWDG